MKRSVSKYQHFGERESAYFSNPAFLDIHVLTSFASKTCGLFQLKLASMREPAYFSNPAFLDIRVLTSFASKTCGITFLCSRLHAVSLLSFKSSVLGHPCPDKFCRQNLLAFPAQARLHAGTGLFFQSGVYEECVLVPVDNHAEFFQFITFAFGMDFHHFSADQLFLRNFIERHILSVV